MVIVSNASTGKMMPPAPDIEENIKEELGASA
jgi:hypothetical protein